MPVAGTNHGRGERIYRYGPERKEASPHNHGTTSGLTSGFNGKPGVRDPLCAGVQCKPSASPPPKSPARDWSPRQDYGGKLVEAERGEVRTSRELTFNERVDFLKNPRVGFAEVPRPKHCGQERWSEREFNKGVRVVRIVGWIGDNMVSDIETMYVRYLHKFVLGLISRPCMCDIVTSLCLC
eukprot:1191345-Prorocentrum_minimum.AAC.1